MKIEKIIVASPSTKDNGGGESLHQLVDACNRLGYDAYIFYFDSMRETVLDRMRIYDIQVVTEVEDSEKNLFICPEMMTYLLKKYKNIRKVIWFLSLDFYLRSLPFYKTKQVLVKRNIPIFFSFLAFPLVLLRTDATFKAFSFRRDYVKYFLYNVEYAHYYIEKECKYDHMSRYLCGPINDIYFINNDRENEYKERIVAYNPQKANAFTQKIIKAFEKNGSDIKFSPIQNLSQDGVKNLLSKASVYMDFGFFPGPERIPREAVIMGCNIITSNLGSASNDIDVPIPSNFKFALKDDNIESIISIITDMVNHYEKYISEFDEYRKKVIGQKTKFKENVRLFLKDIENDEN